MGSCLLNFLLVRVKLLIWWDFVVFFKVLLEQLLKFLLTLRWPSTPPPPPQQVFPVFLKGRAFISNKYSSCGLILETSVRKKFFQIGPTVLALKLDKGRVLEGGGSFFIPIFLTMKMTLNLNEFCCGVR